MYVCCACILCVWTVLYTEVNWSFQIFFGEWLKNQNYFDEEIFPLKFRKIQSLTAAVLIIFKPTPLYLD